MTVETHPVQTHNSKHSIAGMLPKTVTMRAYEVYCEVYSPQKAMVTGGCRSGFSTSEIIAFLYAYPFPKNEWTARVDEAFKGMEGI